IASSRDDCHGDSACLPPRRRHFPAPGEAIHRAPPPPATVPDRWGARRDRRVVRSKPRDERWAALGVVLIGTLIVSLDMTVVGIALPRIGEALDAGGNVQWVVTANLLAVSVSMPAAGWVANRLGAKQVFLAALAVFST